MDKVEAPTVSSRCEFTSFYWFIFISFFFLPVRQAFCSRLFSYFILFYFTLLVRSDNTISMSSVAAVLIAAAGDAIENAKHRNYISGRGEEEGNILGGWGRGEKIVKMDIVSLCPQGDTFLHICGTKMLPKMVCNVKSKPSHVAFLWLIDTKKISISGSCVLRSVISVIVIMSITQVLVKCHYCHTLSHLFLIWQLFTFDHNLTCFGYRFFFFC